MNHHLEATTPKQGPGKLYRMGTKARKNEKYFLVSPFTQPRSLFTARKK
jgi:hypothetical protein